MTADTRPTIFALSSGALPAGIAVVRVSGQLAASALERLTGKLPTPRKAVTAIVRDGQGELLDRALILWMPGPGTATGEDVAELHLHGGRAVVASVLAALGRIDGLRMAEAGEFTRRAFLNGRLDLAQAEGLSDLLAAETETQRRQAMRQAEGGLGRLVSAWREQLLALSASVEAAIEFGEDEDDVPHIGAAEFEKGTRLVASMTAALNQPPAERLRDGVRIVVAGPPNSGKSTLINSLAEREVAIASPVAGTTRDIIEAPVSIEGIACILTDSAGLREASGRVERIGVARARSAVDAADLILWLGSPDLCPDPSRAIIVAPKADRRRHAPAGANVSVSALTGDGMRELRELLIGRIAGLIPAGDAVALNERHRQCVGEAREQLAVIAMVDDPLLVAEHLRAARVALDRITGRAGVEDMLDALFGAFCIGK